MEKKLFDSFISEFGNECTTNRDSFVVDDELDQFCIKIAIKFKEWKHKKL